MSPHDLVVSPLLASLGDEAQRLDGHLAAAISEETRAEIWASAKRILAQGPIQANNAEATGLALGYVQSGKTTSITALIAEAADQGYRLIIAALGVTNLLLDQNRSRIEQALGIGHRNDFRWVVEANPSGRRKVAQISDWLDRGRVVLIPVLKHAGRIDRLAEVLASIDLTATPTLIIDDEADQASLNVDTGSSTLSRTYESITRLRASSPRNLYVQYTATPYAPLLIEKSDHLLPQFVEFLKPGPGYIGGREFFVDFAAQVVRDVPSLEEQNKQAPIELPRTLVSALASFVAGSTLLLANDAGGSPVSMLVHSTHRNDVQARYHFLLDRQVRGWRQHFASASTVEELPAVVRSERERLVRLGAPNVNDATFLEKSRFVINEVVLWLVNSTEAVNRVDWKVAPIHILVGGNKLDRGFTVEGLTVTYMNRKHSNQIDTLEQRARAFGYRRDQLPYCQFFASKRTIKMLRDIVFTEYDLRAGLQDHVGQGGTISSWADTVGLLLPQGARPTRPNVVRALSSTAPGWRSLRLPLTDKESLLANRALVETLGLFDAPKRTYGRLEHRTLELSIHEVLDGLVRPWRIGSYSPGWRRDDIIEMLERHPHNSRPVPVLLLEEPAGEPRIRKWDTVTGFVNLFQGEDVRRVDGSPFYPGDRATPHIDNEPDQVAVQVHRVIRRDDPVRTEILTLAIYLGERPIFRGASGD